MPRLKASRQVVPRWDFSGFGEQRLTRTPLGLIMDSFIMDSFMRFFLIMDSFMRFFLHVISRLSLGFKATSG